MPLSRTPRACERCRRARRRCETPHPCTSCVAAGVSCEVRVKPRPKRTALKRRADARNDAASSRNSLETPRVADELSEESGIESGLEPEREPKPINAFDRVREMVKDLLQKECGYGLSCVLAEPQVTESHDSLRTPATTSFSSPLGLDVLTFDRVTTMLRAFERFNAADLIAPKDLLQLGHKIFYGHDLTLQIHLVGDLVSSKGVTRDIAATLFSAMAIGAVLLGDSRCGLFCFHLATNFAAEFIGPSSFALCLAYFLQHSYVLRMGSSTRARAIIAQTVQACHDLGIQHKSSAFGPRGLHLYLLVYMADQYTSLTHDTAPIIRSSASWSFDSLENDRPHLRPLINLVRLNGCIIEHCCQTSRPSPQTEDPIWLAELEAMMGKIGTERWTESIDRSRYESFTEICEPIARIHMLCCRIQLRVPGLSSPRTWVASISITTHAAASVLSTYFKLYQTALEKLASRTPECTGGVHLLPSTWRQVKRIMLCAMIMFLAYWRGELARDEASRHLAIARLCLEYHRAKWGTALSEAIRLIHDLVRIADFRLQEHMQMLLPMESAASLRRIVEGDVCTPIETGTPPFEQGSGGLEQHADAGGRASQQAGPTAPMQFGDTIAGLPHSGNAFGLDGDINCLSLWQLTEGIWDDGSVHFGNPVF